MIKAVLFDLVGTLITETSEVLNTKEGYYETQVKAIHRSLEKVGISVDWPLFKKHYERVRIRQKERFKKTLREYDMCKRLSETLGYFNYDVPPSSTTIKKAVDAYMDLFLDTLQVHRSTYPILKKLVSQFRLGLVTNFAYSPGAYRALDKFALRRYFEVIAVSGEVGWKKPSPQIFEVTLSKLSVKPEEAIFVGDDYEADIVGPKKVGMKTIYLSMERVDNEKADATIETLKALPSTIKRLSN